MSEVTVDYDLLGKTITDCKIKLEELNDAIDTIKTVIDVIEEQDTPKTLESLGTELYELKETLKTASTENIQSTIDIIETGTDTFESSDNDAAASVGKMGEGE